MEYQVCACRLRVGRRSRRERARVSISAGTYAGGCRRGKLFTSSVLFTACLPLGCCFRNCCRYIQATRPRRDSRQNQSEVPLAVATRPNGIYMPPQMFHTPQKHTHADVRTHFFLCLSLSSPGDNPSPHTCSDSRYIQFRWDRFARHTSVVVRWWGKRRPRFPARCESNQL